MVRFGAALAVATIHWFLPFILGKLLLWRIETHLAALTDHIYLLIFEVYAKGLTVYHLIFHSISPFPFASLCVAYT